MKIITYPHPTLRHRAKPLKRVDAELRSIIAEMFGLMYEARGIGLAANQVDLPYRFFIVNPTGDPEQKDQERVFLNPVLSKAKGSAVAEEGCLSIPGVYADVRRAERIMVQAYDLSGQELEFEADDILARIVQHETDHLDGKLFIDRISPTASLAVRDALDEMETEFLSKRQHGELPGDAVIASRLEELERLRT